MRNIQRELVAQQLKTDEVPEIQTYLGLGPMRWDESYRLRGQKLDQYSVHGDDIVLSSYVVGIYNTECKMCGNHTSQTYTDSNTAIFNHYLHCSREHGYVFPDDQVILDVADRKLQDLIVVCMDYDLPLPGYDDHSECVKRYLGAKIVCAIHKGNEYRAKIWLGTY